MTVKTPMLIAAFLICAAVAAVINTPASYIPVIFLLLICLVSLLYTILAAAFFKLEARPPELLRYERESSARCMAALYNRGVLPLPGVLLSLCVESTQGFPSAVCERLIMLRPRERMEVELPVEFPHIGHYEIKVSRLRFYGFLGILHFDVKPKWSAPVHVTPRLYDIPELMLYTAHAEAAVDFNAPNKVSGGEYSDVRQYVPGDPLKNIHWKLSAHSSDYITRLFKTDAVGGVSVYIDLSLPPDLDASAAADLNDCAAESAYAVAARALELNYQVEMIYSHAGVPTVSRPKDHTDLMAAAYALPPVSVNERYPIPQLVSEYSGNILAHDNIIVISATVNDRLIGVLLDLQRQGKRPLLCRIVADKDADIAAEDARVKGVRRHTVGSARELARVLGE